MAFAISVDPPRRCPSALAIHLRRHGARAAGDQPVMLDAPMLREVEDRLLAEARGVEVTSVQDELVALALRLDDDLAIGVHDERTAEQVMPILLTGLGDGHHPGGVLIGAGLDAESVVEEALLLPLIGLLRIH